MADLNELKIFVESLIDDLEFPNDAKCDLLDALDVVIKNPTASAWFKSLLQQYDETIDCNFPQMLAHIKSMSEVIEVHEYTLSMVLLLCMAKKLKERYIEANISLDVWLHSLRDLRYKLYECRSRYSINGTFVAWWYPGFYKLTRFALGRLQFEITYSAQDYNIDSVVIPAGSKQINMHIPNTGTKLDHDEVLEAYRLASEWFASEFDGTPIVFFCASWLLSPWHAEILPPNSNMVQFYNDFKLILSDNYSNYNHLWLLFGRTCDGNTEDLPKDSSLRRAYVELMDKKLPAMWGRGAFIYRDGKIINE